MIKSFARFIHGCRCGAQSGSQEDRLDAGRRRAVSASPASALMNGGSLAAFPPHRWHHTILVPEGRELTRQPPGDAGDAPAPCR
ncbi:hypothetical protein M8494_06920 [Serratia ureilytica]